MNKIRNLNDLNDAMAQAFAWRRKELHDLKTLVHTHRDTHLSALCIRGGVTVLYAHWEGFVKEIGTAYLEFVSRQRLRNEELTHSLLALACRTILNEAVSSTKIGGLINVVEFFRAKMVERSEINWRTGIRTKANLKAEVFRDIVTVLGLDYGLYATKEKLIDERLLKNRNEIAHGKYLRLGYADYVDLHDEMVLIMETFYNQVDNAARTGAYRVHAPA